MTDQLFDFARERLCLIVFSLPSLRCAPKRLPLFFIFSPFSLPSSLFLCFGRELVFGVRSLSDCSGEVVACNAHACLCAPQVQSPWYPRHIVSRETIFLRFREIRTAHRSDRWQPRKVSPPFRFPQLVSHRARKIPPTMVHIVGGFALCSVLFHVSRRLIPRLCGQFPARVRSCPTVVLR